MRKKMLVTLGLAIVLVAGISFNKVRSQNSKSTSSISFHADIKEISSLDELASLADYVAVVSVEKELSKKSKPLFTDNSEETIASKEKFKKLGIDNNYQVNQFSLNVENVLLGDKSSNKIILEQLPVQEEPHIYPGDRLVIFANKVEEEKNTYLGVNALVGYFFVDDNDNIKSAIKDKSIDGIDFSKIKFGDFLSKVESSVKNKK